MFSKSIFGGVALLCVVSHKCLSRLGLSTVPLNHTVWSFTHHAPNEPPRKPLLSSTFTF
jgi:hypothetical protein